MELRVKLVKDNQVEVRNAVLEDGGFPQSMYIDLVKAVKECSLQNVSQKLMMS